MAKRILVVDDGREIVRLVRTCLEKSGYEVLTAHDGETALHILRRERPDLVLLDLMLPERDGWDVTRVVRDDVSLAAMPIVGLELDADDYVSQPFNPRQVVASIRTVLRRARGEPPSPGLVRAGELIIDLEAHQVWVEDQLVHLTRTEMGLLQVLAEQPGRAFTRLELIEKGLGYSYEGLERTVDSHIKNIRRKLTAAGLNATLVETVFGVGYRLATGSD